MTAAVKMTTEERRHRLQLQLDGQKSQQERNLMGQFSTPFGLAREMVDYSIGQLHTGTHVRMLEPACGTGVFFSALQDVAGTEALNGSLGFEIDPHYFYPAKKLWAESGADIRCCDFLAQPATQHFPLLVANPPYSRHHHIPPQVKETLRRAVREQTGMAISGLAGLYCYFLLLSSQWLSDGGVSCWLIPSEFMDVNYGKTVREYLLSQVDLLRIHRFCESDLQFSDALVSSAVVVFRKGRPSCSPVLFTYGGSFASPSSQRTLDRRKLAGMNKWNSLFSAADGAEVADSETLKTLGDYFEVKRGIATGGNDFFVVDAETVSRYSIPDAYLTPILPSPRKMQLDIIESDGGLPLLGERLFLFSTSESKETIAAHHPSVLDYIRKGEEAGVHKSYICSRHTPWYSCEKRASAPFVIPYMGRGEAGRRLFRFILNESEAIATNGYLLMYPRREYRYLFRNREFVRRVWQELNTLPAELFVRHGRVYGGGLHKMEPRELLSLPAKGVGRLLGNEIPWVA